MAIAFSPDVAVPDQPMAAAPAMAPSVLRELLADQVDAEA